MNVAPQDLKLLTEKFQDPATGDINYPAFVQAVDAGRPNYQITNFYAVKVSSLTNYSTFV